MKTVKGQQGLSPVYVHAGLAVLAVLFAYQTWTRDRAQTQTDSVVVLDVTKREVASLAYLDETRLPEMQEELGLALVFVLVATDDKDANAGCCHSACEAARPSNTAGEGWRQER